MLRPLSALLLLLGLATGRLPAQGPAGGGMSFPPRPGLVLMDDEWLPEEVVYGESVFTPDPWPNGQVPYRFDFVINTARRELFRDYVTELECLCGIDFFEDTLLNQSDYILVTNSADPGVSSSEVGYQGGSQILRIWPGGAPGAPADHWPQRLVVIHELMHALGFRHEQTRPDRDFFVTINWNQIPSSRHFNFEILTFLNQPTTVGLYDFDSIMHYGSCNFSVCTTGSLTGPCVPPTPSVCPGGGTAPPTPGCFTITTLDPAMQGRIGNRCFVSDGDVQGLQAVYGQTSVFPVISLVAPAVIPADTLTTLTITGEDFYLRSTATGTGERGSLVKINGVAMTTTYVDRNTLTVSVPASLAVSGTCLDVVVNNEFFGDSMPMQIGVLASSSSATVFPGSAPDANAGTSVAGAGDVNGDARDDVVIGMPHYPVLNLPSAGRVECRSGADGSLLWFAEFGLSRLAGTSLACADFNLDRIADVVVGCPGVAGLTGGVYVVDGRDGTNLLAVPGLQNDDGFGHSVAIASDLTGDAVPEIVVGAPLITQARVIDGSTGATLQIFNGAAFSSFGIAVSGGQDLNGNGVADIAVGAPANNNGQGQVSVYDGLTQNLILGLSGGAAGGSFGAAVALIPSVTRRNVGTLLVGRPSWSADTGRVEVWDGLNGVSYTNLATIPGAAPGDFFGRSVGAAGDLDQDGFHDFLAGAPEGAGFGGTGPGYVRLFDGRTLAGIATYSGGAPDDGFGWAVGRAGDTNGDALADLIIGSPFADPGCGESGLAQVLRPRIGPVQRSLRLSEVRWASPPGVEITNHDLAPIQVQGWRIRWIQGTSIFDSAALPNLLLQSGHSVLAGFFPTGNPPFPETPPGVESFSVLPPFTANADGITVGLVTPGGVTLDEVRIQPLPGGIPASRTAGGMFRGIAPRTSAAERGAERVWGLDSNAGHDWTAQPATSMGLENRSSGIRGIDTDAVDVVVINEIDDDPDYVEFRNLGGGAADVEGWFLLVKAGPTDAHQLIEPWTQPTAIPAGGYFVIGEGPPPAEMPPGTPYVNLLAPSAGGSGPPLLLFGTEAFEVALYDLKGRLVDLVRVQRLGSQKVHNDPRAPAAWDDFGGAAARFAGTAAACGRNAPSTDTDTGADWRPIQVRTMGTDNLAGTWAGGPGHGHAYDVRLNDNTGGGLTVIINAGAQHAGHRWSFLFSLAPLQGAGPLFGLGADALANYLAVSSVPPWFGILDAQGSARLDFPAGSLPPGIHTEDIFILQAPSGGVVFLTKVITFDT